MTRKLLFAVFITICLAALAVAADIDELKQKAQSGDVTAQMQLADAYETGKGVRADRFQAFDWYLKAAEAGNPEAQNIVGVNLRTGDGGLKDPVKALVWYRKSAAQGNAEAMFNLGTAYYNGDGIGIDDAEALAWFAVASDFGSQDGGTASQRSLLEVKPQRKIEGLTTAAIRLRRGTEIPRKPEAAVTWLKKAIELKSMDAQVMLAKMYLDGEGVPKDPQMAVSLCEDPANHGYSVGMTCMAYIAKNGYGLPTPDLKKALYWYGKGANCGDVSSLFTLGEMYEKGDGVRPDALTAYEYYSIAAMKEPKAKEALNRLDPALGPKDLKKASEATAGMMRKIRSTNCKW
jgi:uncharacterized protein